MGAGHGAGATSPRILVFSTANISDPGIDLAGSQHRHYASSISTITVPCSSSIQPRWIVYALEHGFDGVFLAIDGDECAYLPDCNARSSRIAAQAQERLRPLGIALERVRMAALCSVCSEAFVKHMDEFAALLAALPVEVAA